MSTARLPVVCVLSAWLLVTPLLATAAPITYAAVPIVDTLGSAEPTDTFSIFGASGHSFFGVFPFGAAFVGPQFTLTQPSVLRSVGGFVNSCASIMFGVPQCVPASPIHVQIRPSRGADPDAGPDPDRLLASYLLSHDDDPLTVSFESASFSLPLAAGTYFALFALPAGEAGLILAGAQDPFEYRAPSTMFGVLDPISGLSAVWERAGAVQVTATPIPEPGTLSLLVVGAAVAAAVRSRRRRCPRLRSGPDHLRNGDSQRPGRPNGDASRR